MGFVCCCLRGECLARCSFVRGGGGVSVIAISRRSGCSVLSFCTGINGSVRICCDPSAYYLSVSAVRPCTGCGCCLLISTGQ